MKEVPFHKVYLHAMVRDEKGEKMSKSKGNVIDPLVVIEQHGADPLRFTFAAMAGQGRDIKLSVDRVAGYRAFCNKIWNATKFFLLQLEQAPPSEVPQDLDAWFEDHRLELPSAHRWILSQYQTVVASVQKSLESFELDQAARALYDFAWLDFCDWFIEFSKLTLRDPSPIRDQTLWTLHYVLDGILKVLHPFTPFVTEVLWQQLPWTKNTGRLKTVMLQEFPKTCAHWVDPEATKVVQNLKSIIEAIRNFRGENNISPKQEFEVKFVTTVSGAVSFVKLHQEQIVALSKISAFKLASAAIKTGGGMQAVIPLSHPPLELVIDLSSLVNVGEERKRLTKEIERVKGDIDHLNRKLTNESFVAKAPPDLVVKERQREKDLVAKKTELEAALHRLPT